MSIKKFTLYLVSLAMLLSGCMTQVPTMQPPTSPTSSLSIELSHGQQVQAIESDIASGTATVKIGEFVKTSPGTVKDGQFFFDLDQLPEGEATVTVKVFDKDGLLIGEGQDYTLLQIGRRNFMHVYVYLSMAGRTTRTPATPIYLLFEEARPPVAA